MCYSAEASFVSAGVLVGIGVMATKTISNKRDILWAIIPILFGIQQFCEGLVWLDLRQTIEHSWLTEGAKDAYLLFSYAFWPVWIPLSLMVAETQTPQKIIMGVFIVIGVAVAVMNFITLEPFDITPTIYDHSIRYTDEGPFYKRIAYILAVSIPTFFSSIRLFWIFGIFAIISSVAAAYFYTFVFTSVWCFVGALLSLLLFAIAKYNTENPRPVK